METNVAEKTPHIIRINRDLIYQKQQFQKVLDKKEEKIQRLETALNEKHEQHNALELKDIEIEGLRLELMNRDRRIKFLKKENELLIQLRACKETETKTLRVIFFDSGF